MKFDVKEVHPLRLSADPVAHFREDEPAMLGKRVLFTIALAVAVTLCAVLYAFLPAVDNLLKIQIPRDIRTVMNAKSGGGTIEVALRTVVRDATCTGWHRDWLWQTFVACSGTNKDGRAADFYWEVDNDRSPRFYQRADGVYITVLTRATAVLTPEYRPAGVTLSDIPEGPSTMAEGLYGLSDQSGK